jgi:hypothetical protein
MQSELKKPTARRFQPSQKETKELKNVESNFLLDLGHCIVRKFKAFVSKAKGFIITSTHCVDSSMESNLC